jgi:hypothetical protein
MNIPTEENSKRYYSFYPRMLEYKILAFVQISINNLAPRYYDMVFVPDKEKNLETVIVSGVLLVAFMFSAWMLLGLEIENTSLATLTSTNDTNTESTNITNATSTPGTNGSISIITPQELQDRRHAPS